MVPGVIILNKLFILKSYLPEIPQLTAQSSITLVLFMSYHSAVSKQRGSHALGRSPGSVLRVCFTT